MLVLRIIRAIRDNIFAVVITVLSLWLVITTKRAGRAEEKNKELARENRELEIKADANEVRSDPVPSDKSHILGRM